jgi:Arc/MetJ family transcription regulator
MRTTLSLDDDVTALLKRARKLKKASLKEVVNEAMRHGLQHMLKPERRSTRYRTQGVSLGRCLVGNLDDVAEVLATAEDEAFR